MGIRSSLLLACLAATVAAADGPSPAPTGDLARLQGRWTALFGSKKNIPMVVTIRGSEVTMTMTNPDGRDRESKGRIKIDEGARPHKTIDWLDFTNREGKPAPANLGIYTLDGDTLTVCNGGPGRERPSEFRAGEKGTPQLIVLDRKPAADIPADAASGAVPAPAPARANPDAGDRARLQGRWSARIGPEKKTTLVVTIRGSGVALNFSGAEGTVRESKGEIRIDENARPHKTLDWVNFTRPDGGPVPANPAIYKLEGDTLTICSGGPGNERPSEFRAGEGGKPSLLVLSRE